MEDNTRSATRINKQAIFDNLPPEWPEELFSEIRRWVVARRQKVVVLDDDPTGTQTVHSVPVLTEWPVKALRDALADDNTTAFYLLTNSRSLPLSEARELNAEIGRNLLAASELTGRTFVVVSRSDSTLRGHFPGEIESLAGALGTVFDAWLIVPFFLEGGRYTLHNVHYVAEGENLVPAGVTEYAQDPVFGYQASNLRQWVIEKWQTFMDTHPSYAETWRVPSSLADVATISLDDIRNGGPDKVTKRLLGLKNGQTCIVNAVSYHDLEVFVLGLLVAESRGRHFLYRTAASFVRVRAGIAPRPLLTRADADTSHSLTLSEEGGGLLIVGSHVPRTTRQIQMLLDSSDIEGIEVKVPALMNFMTQMAEIRRVVSMAEMALSQSRDVVLYTSRHPLTGESANENLAIGQRVSDSLVAIARSIRVRPRYLLAKGGITSSDIATRGLDVKKAQVLGQILPGVPVWALGLESRYPGMPYIVFPGNVGGPSALADIVEKLK